MTESLSLTNVRLTIEKDGYVLCNSYDSYQYSPAVNKFTSRLKDFFLNGYFWTPLYAMYLGNGKFISEEILYSRIDCESYISDNYRTQDLNLDKIIETKIEHQKREKFCPNLFKIHILDLINFFTRHGFTEEARLFMTAADMEGHYIPILFDELRTFEEPPLWASLRDNLMKLGIFNVGDLITKTEEYLKSVLTDKEVDNIKQLLSNMGGLYAKDDTEYLGIDVFTFFN